MKIVQDLPGDDLDEDLDFDAEEPICRDPDEFDLRDKRIFIEEILSSRNKLPWKNKVAEIILANRPMSSKAREAMESYRDAKLFDPKTLTTIKQVTLAVKKRSQLPVFHDDMVKLVYQSNERVKMALQWQGEETVDLIEEEETAPGINDDDVIMDDDEVQGGDRGDVGDTGDDGGEGPDEDMEVQPEDRGDDGGPVGVQGGDVGDTVDDVQERWSSVYDKITKQSAALCKIPTTTIIIKKNRIVRSFRSWDVAANNPENWEQSGTARFRRLSLKGLTEGISPVQLRDYGRGQMFAMTHDKTCVMAPDDDIESYVASLRECFSFPFTVKSYLELVMARVKELDEKKRLKKKKGKARQRLGL